MMIQGIAVTGITVGTLMMATSEAKAQCVPFANSSICAPKISGVNAPNGTTIDISWVYQGGLAPQSVKLIKDGSASGNWVDGSILATQGGNPQSGKFTLTVPANTTYPTLHVVAYWNGTTIASASFAGTTVMTPPASFPAPVAIGQPYTNGTITVTWTAGRSYDSYNVRWSPGAQVALNAYQWNGGAGADGAHSINEYASGPYTFAVQGCVTNLFGLASKGCSHWSNPVTVTVPPSSGPVTNKSFTFDTRQKGDCTLQKGTIVFSSDGIVTWDAQVKTDHTSSGDYWHINIYPHGKNQQNVQVGGQGLTWRWTSMKMEDNHGFYNWHYMTNYNPQFYSVIDSVYETSSC